MAASADALFRIGKSTLPVLLQSLADRDVHVRCTAVRALQQFGTDARVAIPALRDLLKDGDEEVRAAAKEAILQIE